MKLFLHTITLLSKCPNEAQNSRVTKSSYETELNDVTLRVTNSEMFIGILLSSY